MEIFLDFISDFRYYFIDVLGGILQMIYLKYYELEDGCYDGSRVSAGTANGTHVDGLNSGIGEGHTYAEAFEDFREKFRAYVEELKSFEKEIFSEKPPRPVIIDEYMGTDYAAKYVYWHVKRADNDDRIRALLESPPEPYFRQTLLTACGTCEMTECVHNRKKQCTKTHICASRVERQNFLCLDKEIPENAYKQK